MTYHSPSISTPNAAPPQRVTIPAGDARFPDVENAMVTVLDGLLEELDPAGYACIVPPENYMDLLQQGVALVEVESDGGAASSRVNDSCVVYVSVTTGYRSDSWAVLGWLRPKLNNYSGVVANPDGTQAIITDISDMRIPKKDTANTANTTRVTAGFTVTTRLDR